MPTPDRTPDQTPPPPEPATPPVPQMALAEWLRRLMWGYDTDPDTGMGPAAHASRSAAHADLALAATVAWLRAQVTAWLRESDLRAETNGQPIGQTCVEDVEEAKALAYVADLLQDALPGYAATLPDQMAPEQAAELPALPSSHLNPQGRINPLAPPPGTGRS